MDLSTPMVVNLIVVFFLPIAVAAVTKYSASSKLKSLVLLFLATVSTVLTQYLGKTEVNVPELLALIVGSYGLSVASYYGLWKPTSTAEAVGQATAGFGLGKG